MKRFAARLKPASAFFFLGVPIIYGCLLVAAIALCARGRHEVVAGILCHFLTTGMVFLPVVVVAANGAFFRRRTNAFVQLCAVHLCWNAHLLPMASAAYPFLAHRYWRGAGSYAGVLYDASGLVLFVCGPVVLATGAVKGVASRRRRKFGWKHRAYLGAGSFAVFLGYVAGCWRYRRDTVAATLLSSCGFYGYACASYLPANPQGDGPEITGEREWPALRTFLRPYLWDPVISYLNLHVVVDEAARARDDRDATATASLRAAEASAKNALRHLGGLAATAEIRRLRASLESAAAAVGRCADAAADGAVGELREGEAVVLGFHPHGIIPFNSGMMLYGDDWRAALGDRLPRAIVCTDAFTHVVPWMRDLGQWLGMRECTRTCVGAALDAGVSCVLVPGGQAEIFASRSWGKTVEVFRGHRGFVRLALERRARLVPVFSFGEWELMDNVYWPRLQRRTRALLGFPVPFWPYGKWGLPLPRKPPRGVTVVVGRPIEIPLDGGVDDAAVETCHAAYFAALRDIFERHKAGAGYPDHALVFDDGPTRGPKVKLR